MRVVETQRLTVVFIRQLLKRYVAHREWMYDNLRAYRNAEHLQAIINIKNRLAHNEKKDLATHCRMVLNLEKELRSILPGKTSRFYDSRVEMLENLIKQCKEVVYGK